jgi:ABC-type branched-subunit amino acid transport system substrate-binding protein
MNFYRIFDKIFILLLVIFSISCSTMAIDAKKPVQIPSPEVNFSPEKPEGNLSPEKPPVVELPAIIPPSDKLNRNTLGCVLPLSGQYADLGNKARDAILLATGIFDEKNKPLWKVIFEDSRGLPEETKAAIAHLANAENVMAIIAVTGTAEAMDAAREADKWKVPLILITSKEEVTSIGEYVFQNFLTPTQQIRALVKYSRNDLNCAIFSVLYPKDDYGEEMVKIFSEEVIRMGGKVEKAIPYNRNQTDFKEEINKLTGTIVNAPQKKRGDQTETKTTISVDFEALFIPDSYSRVKLITSQLDFYDVKGFQLLGTSLWHSSDLLKNSTEYLEEAIFVDSFFTHSIYPKTNIFVDAYYSKYSREPDNIEALAYDTAEIIISLLDDMEIKTRGQFAAALKKVEVYEGVTGKISFGSDRVAQKTPFILKVKKGKLEQVK